MLLAAITPPATAQQPGEVLCWRGRPRSDCLLFPLLEIQGMLPLAREKEVPDRYRDTRVVFGRRVEAMFGVMVNVAPRWAIGGSFVGGGNEEGGAHSGFRARVRRWISPSYSGELTAGYLFEDVLDARGFTAEARLNGGDLAALFVRWNAFHVPRPVDYSWHPYRGGFEQAVDVGAAIGSTPAAFAMPVLFVAVVRWAMGSG